MRAAGRRSANSRETGANGAAARRIAPPLHLPRFGAMTRQMDHDHGSYYRRYFGQAFYTSKDRRIAPLRSGPQLRQTAPSFPAISALRDRFPGHPRQIASALWREGVGEDGEI